MSNNVDMVFRKVKRGDHKGEIIAFMPPVVNGIITIYAHIGQHSDADYSFYRDMTAPATPTEYAELFKELDCLYCHYGDGNDFDKINVRQRVYFCRG